MSCYAHDASLVWAGEKTFMPLRQLRRRDAIAFAMQDNRRHGDHRLSREFGLGLLEPWITLRRSVAVPVGMDHNVDKIRVMEGFGGSLVFSVVETDVRRPQLPQCSTEGSTVPRFFSGYGARISPSDALGNEKWHRRCQCAGTKRPQGGAQKPCLSLRPEVAGAPTGS